MTSIGYFIFWGIITAVFSVTMFKFFDLFVRIVHAIEEIAYYKDDK